VDLQNIEAGDMIIMMDAGLGSDRDHVLIVDQIDYENNILKKLHYTHSLNWTSDGKYNHGVKQGIIEITDINKSLREQKWIEQNKSDDENETFGRARRAKFLSIMRLNCLNK
ncbi:hypothetical protein KKA94_00615, partial [Patescibacteria group bacterium]|nr:hypothetical protein [Patescibacteria group bacterium]